MKYIKRNRIFTEEENLNNLYRESETFAKIYHDTVQIGKNIGTDNQLYDTAYDSDAQNQKI